MQLMVEWWFPTWVGQTKLPVSDVAIIGLVLAVPGAKSPGCHQGKAPSNRAGRVPCEPHGNDGDPAPVSCRVAMPRGGATTHEHALRVRSRVGRGMFSSSAAWASRLPATTSLAAEILHCVQDDTVAGRFSATTSPAAEILRLRSGRHLSEVTRGAVVWPVGSFNACLRSRNSRDRISTSWHEFRDVFSSSLGAGLGRSRPHPGAGRPSLSARGRRRPVAHHSCGAAWLVVARSDTGRPTA